jgi:Na+/phosphate symporter
VARVVSSFFSRLLQCLLIFSEWKSWLVALIGVRVSLTAAALAGFALVLFGLTTLQQGMGGVAERLHPADLPAVLAGPGTGWWVSLIGVLALVVVGVAMTAVMQSSTAAIALTLSAHYAGAIGLDQGCALIIGQNIGTATSSAMAAIGASAPAKRLALAYVLFKLIAAVIALVLFPFVTSARRAAAFPPCRHAGRGRDWLIDCGRSHGSRRHGPKSRGANASRAAFFGKSCRS